MRDELRDGESESLAWGLLFSLASSEPSAGEQLADAVGRPVGGDLVDDVDEVDVGVDADELAVEQDGEQVGIAVVIPKVPTSFDSSSSRSRTAAPAFA
jgi:hypothetical protein